MRPPNEDEEEDPAPPQAEKGDKIAGRNSNGRSCFLVRCTSVARCRKLRRVDYLDPYRDRQSDSTRPLAPRVHRHP